MTQFQFLKNCIKFISICRIDIYELKHTSKIELNEATIFNTYSKSLPF